MQRSTSTCKVLYLLYFFLIVLTMLVLCYVNPQIPNFPILIQHRPHKIVGVFCLSEHFWFVFMAGSVLLKNAQYSMLTNYAGSAAKFY